MVTSHLKEETMNRSLEHSATSLILQRERGARNVINDCSGLHDEIFIKGKCKIRELSGWRTCGGAGNVAYPKRARKV